MHKNMFAPVNAEFSFVVIIYTSITMNCIYLSLILITISTSIQEVSSVVKMKQKHKTLGK